MHRVQEEDLSLLSIKSIACAFDTHLSEDVALLSSNHHPPTAICLKRDLDACSTKEPFALDKTTEQAHFVC